MTQSNASQNSFFKHYKSFIGYLEGTLKSKNTIQSYKLDLGTFEEYLKDRFGHKKINFTLITKKDIDHYYEYLKVSKLKINSRRRKLLTVRRFLRYLNKRKKFGLDLSDKIPAPHKHEVVPFVFDIPECLDKINQIPVKDWIELRNQTVLLTLIETGCLVSEVSELKKMECLFLENQKQCKIKFIGKNEREVVISPLLCKKIERLVSETKGNEAGPWIFLGSNRYGPLKGHITSRGIELLVKSYRETLGLDKLTARQIRHSVIFNWLKHGIPFSEVKLRLGLKSDYAFRSYEPLVKAFKKAEKSIEIQP